MKVVWLTLVNHVHFFLSSSSNLTSELWWCPKRIAQFEMTFIIEDGCYKLRKTNKYISDFTMRYVVVSSSMWLEKQQCMDIWRSLPTKMAPEREYHIITFIFGVSNKRQKISNVFIICVLALLCFMLVDVDQGHSQIERFTEAIDRRRREQLGGFKFSAFWNSKPSEMRFPAF